MNSEEITLTQLLESRDKRRENQLRLLEANQGKTLIVLTVVIPGSVKRNADSLAIARAGRDSIAAAFGERGREVEYFDLPTGFESYWISDLDVGSTKEITARIEDTHLLGRMMDIDVFGSDAKAFSRTDIGQTSRRCLICNNDARICMRAFSHTQAELIAEIHRRVALWESSSGL